MRRVLKTIALAVGLLLLAACGSSGGQFLQEGDQAPPFTLPTVNGQAVELAQFKGEQPVLLYFHMAVG